MPRPTTKAELIDAGNETFSKMLDLLHSIPSDQVDQPFTFNVENEKQAHWKRDKNLRDVLIHLYEWHRMLLNWVESNQAGNPKPFLPEGYNWKTYGQLNVLFRDQHQDTSYQEALDLVQETHAKVMELEQQFSNDELFTRNAFPWSGGSTLGSSFASSTSSHYDWAIKKIKRFKKSL